MDYKILNIIRRLARNGVLHRDEAKNDMEAIERLVYHGLLRKFHRGKKVFYELTESSVPVLELWRKALLEEVRVLAFLHKPPSVFHALLDDVRFLDEDHVVAEQFKFLGDWQLQRPVVPAQLELSKIRYYQTIASTVDLTHCATVEVYKGKNLTIDSVTPKDLLKLKLERFYKQDPEDIYAIIKHEAMSFEEFRLVVKDMIPDYIGNIRQLIISAQIVVEQIWPSRADEFKINIP